MPMPIEPRSVLPFPLRHLPLPGRPSRKKPVRSIGKRLPDREGTHPRSYPPAGGYGHTPRATSVIAVGARCALVQAVAAEIVEISDVALFRRNRRFAAVHIQQIAMYVCHVVLQITMTDIGRAFRRDRTTVGHACGKVEDRRDDDAYDAVLIVIERLVAGIFRPRRSGARGFVSHELRIGGRP